MVSFSILSFDELVKYDRQFFPADRNTFLNCWIKQPDSVALASRINNQIKGYGMIRKCRTGYKIGSLFAENFEVANNLFQSLVGSIPENTPVFLDIPEINPEAIELVNKYSMKKGFSTARMYTKTPPKLPIERIYGVTTYEIG